MNWSPAVVALDPPGVVATTCTVPPPSGDVTVQLDAEVQLTAVAGLGPNLNVGAAKPGPVKPDPAIAMPVVPPAADPVLGVTLVIVGVGA